MTARPLLSALLRDNVKTSADHDCWLWTGGMSSSGYGNIKMDGKYTTSSRVAWSVANGKKIPEGKLVLHRCDVRACVNPAHLWIGTHKDNMQDCAAKGRVVAIPQPGERNSQAKLSNAQVLEIRASNESCEAVSKRYGIDPSNVGLIRKRKTWKLI